MTAHRTSRQKTRLHVPLRSLRGVGAFLSDRQAVYVAIFPVVATDFPKVNPQQVVLGYASHVSVSTHLHHT